MVRSYERIFYALCALAGLVWGALAMVITFEKSAGDGLVRWVALWPASADLAIRSELSTTWLWQPILESSVIGAFGVCAAAYALVSISHIRE